MMSWKPATATLDRSSPIRLNARYKSKNHDIVMIKAKHKSDWPPVGNGSRSRRKWRNHEARLKCSASRNSTSSRRETDRLAHSQRDGTVNQGRQQHRQKEPHRKVVVAQDVNARNSRATPVMGTKLVEQVEA